MGRCRCLGQSIARLSSINRIKPTIHGVGAGQGISFFDGGPGLCFSDVDEPTVRTPVRKLAATLPVSNAYLRPEFDQNVHSRLDTGKVLI